MSMDAITARLRDPELHPEERAEAAMELAQFGAEAIDPLVEVIEIMDEGIQEAARNALLEIDGEAELARRAGDGSIDAAKRAASARAIRFLRLNDSTRETLRGLLGQRDSTPPDVVDAAAMTLALRPIEADEAAFLDLLGAETPRFRYWAAIALGVVAALGSTPAAEALRARQGEETDDSVKVEIDWALQQPGWCAPTTAQRR